MLGISNPVVTRYLCRCQVKLISPLLDPTRSRPCRRPERCHPPVCRRAPRGPRRPPIPLEGRPGRAHNTTPRLGAADRRRPLGVRRHSADGACQVFLPPSGSSTFVTPSFGPQGPIWPEGPRPTVRTYTPRRFIDGLLEIQFLVHGDGPVSAGSRRGAGAAGRVSPPGGRFRANHRPGAGGSRGTRARSRPSRPSSRRCPTMQPVRCISRPTARRLPRSAHRSNTGGRPGRSAWPPPG